MLQRDRMVNAGATVKGDITRRCASVRCHLCGKTLASKHYLKVHIQNVHQGRKDHKCNQCGKRYTQAGDLKAHIATVHKGVRYKCSHCGKLYTQRSSMLQHVRAAHPAEAEGAKHKNPQCDLCGMTFTRPYQVTCHKASAHGVCIPGRPEPRPRKCPCCDYATTKLSNLKRHVASRHPERDDGSAQPPALVPLNAGTTLGASISVTKDGAAPPLQQQQRGRGTKRHSLGERAASPEQFRGRKALHIAVVEL